MTALTARLLGRQVHVTANSPATPRVDAQLVTAPQGTHCAMWPLVDSRPARQRGGDYVCDQTVTPWMFLTHTAQEIRTWLASQRP